MIPAAGSVVERAQHPARREAAHLGERRDPEPELHRVVLVAAPLLLGAQLVVPEHLLGPGGRRLVVAGVVLQATHRRERELVVLDPVLLADLERVHPDLGRELVHDPLDGVRRLRPAGAAVGVGPGLVGEHRLHLEVVRRELVDRVEHERAEHRYAAPDERDVGAQVGEQLDLEPGDRAVLLRRQRELLPLVAAVVAGDERLGPGLGVLHRLLEPAGHGPGDELLGSRLELAAEPATDVGGDHADLRLRDPGGRGQREPQDVRDLRRRPHGHLLGRSGPRPRSGAP